MLFRSDILTPLPRKNNTGPQIGPKTINTTDNVVPPLGEDHQPADWPQPSLISTRGGTGTKTAVVDATTSQTTSVKRPGIATTSLKWSSRRRCPTPLMSYGDDTRRLETEWRISKAN